MLKTLNAKVVSGTQSFDSSLAHHGFALVTINTGNRVPTQCRTATAAFSAAPLNTKIKRT